MGSLASGSLLGDFRIEGELGRGGMGVVYRASQLSLARPVALKVIASALAGDEGFQERFVRESRLAASLDHPNVIPVFAAGEHDGVLYIAMRYVEGTDLRRLIARTGGLDPVRAAGVVAQVASALDAAHERGLVHRDVKPANVLVAARGGGEHVYLTDFGLTKGSASDTGLTGAGEWVGTLDYVAPEQVRGDAVDGRADVYALGCVLHEAVTGQVPFPRETELAKLWAHISDPPPSVLDMAPEAPPGLAAVCSRAMEKDPDDRFQTAGELGRAALMAVPGGADTGARARAAAARSVMPGAGDAALPPTQAMRTAVTARRYAVGATVRRRPILTLAAVTLGLVAAAAALALGHGGSSERAAPPGTATAAGRVAGAPIRVGDSPGGVAVGAGAVWVANTDDDTISRIDPDSGRRVSRPIPVGEDPGAIATGAGAVWVANLGDGTVTRLDPRSARPAGAPVPVGGAPTDLAVGSGRVWVATQRDRVVTIDPKTNALAGNPISVKADGSLALAGDVLWVSDRLDAAVRSIETRSRSIFEAPVATGASPADIEFAGGHLWVSVPGDGAIERVDPGRSASQARTIRLGGSPEYLAARGRALWVTNGDDETVARLDSRSGDPMGRPLAVGEDPSGVALGGGAVWVTSAVEDSVTRVVPR